MDQNKKKYVDRDFDNVKLIPGLCALVHFHSNGGSETRENQYMDVSSPPIHKKKVHKYLG